MDYLKLAEERKSIREFKENPVTGGQKKEIFEYFASCRRLDKESRLELVMFDSGVKEQLEGIAGYAGFVTGAPYYLVMLSEGSGAALVNAGYACEDMILKLTDMGLSSCWNTFKDKEAVKNALDIQSDLEVAAVLAYGYGKKEKEQTRLTIESPSSVHVHKRDAHLAPKISLSDFVYHEAWGQSAQLDENLVDEGLLDAMYAASLSPSLLNRQPYRLILDFGMVVLAGCADEMTDPVSEKLNYGALMLNFAAALSMTRPTEPQWILGEPAKRYELPDGCRVIGYCPI